MERRQQLPAGHRFGQRDAESSRAEAKAGADATIAIEERLAPEFEGSPVETGIWVQELKTWFQPPTKDWYTGVSTERMSLGFLDPLDLHLETVQHDILDVQDDLYPAGEWMTSGDEADRWYAEVFLQPLFHPESKRHSPRRPRAATPSMPGTARRGSGRDERED